MKKTNMRTQATQTDVKRQREQQLLQLQQINQMRRTNSGRRKVRLDRLAFIESVPWISSKVKSLLDS